MFYRAGKPDIRTRKPFPFEALCVNMNHPRNLGLRAWWIFNELGALKIEDLLGINTGVISGITSTNPRVVSPTGWALNFGGSNDIATVEDGGTIQVTGTKITIATTIYPRTTGGGTRGRILEKIASNNGWNFQMEGTTVANGLGMTVGDGVGTTGVNSNANAITLNTWQRVVVTYDGADIVFYVNGKNAGSGAATRSITNGAIHAQICNNDANTRNFDGLISDLQLFSRPWTQQEVLDDYFSPFGPTYFPRILTMSRRRFFNSVPAGGLVLQSNLDGLGASGPYFRDPLGG